MFARFIAWFAKQCDRVGRHESLYQRSKKPPRP